MELDDIKNILQNDVPTESISKDAFTKAKSTKSLHPAEKIKRKVLYENLLGLILALIFIVFIAINKKSLTLLIEIFAISILSLGLVYGFLKVYQLKKLLNYSGSTKDFLTNFKTAINGYIKALTISALILLPFAFYLGFTMGFSLKSGLDFAQAFLEILAKPRYLIIAITSGTIVTFACYYLIKFIYRKIYGKQIKEIEELLTEIE